MNTTDRFPRAFALLKVHEGGYSNHPDDPGGATMKGVTQRTYDWWRRTKGWQTQNVKNITDGEVEEIYRGQYWDAVRADELPSGVAYCVFDAAVNSGPGRAARWLQQHIGAGVDGVVGNETIAKAREADPVDLINRYCGARLSFMKRLPHWKTFSNGWIRRVAEVRAQSINWAQAQPVPESREAPQAKAEGPEKKTATLKDMATDTGTIGAVGGLVGSTGALASGDGPVQYAIAAVLVLVALGALWWIVRGRHK